MGWPANPRRAHDLALAEECRLNLLWLHGAARRECALEVDVGGPSLSPALQCLYERVERGAVRGTELALPAESRGDAGFDLVTFYGRAPDTRLLAAARRQLRPGGALFIAAPNRWWYGGGAGVFLAGGSSGAGCVRSLRANGYGDVRMYWVEPSLAIPRNLVPATERRVRDFEMMRAQDAESGAARAAVLAAGLHVMLYPAFLVLAVH